MKTKKLMGDFFCGTKSMAKAATKKGWEVYTLDNNPRHKADDTMDIRHYRYNDMIYFAYAHFSPPCTGFSVASIGTHWGGGKGAYVPKSDTARLGLELLDATINLIAHGLKLNPDFKWTLENPRGVMRKVIDKIFKKYGITDYHRTSAWYCRYGDIRAKPTDWWHNLGEYDAKGCKNFRYDEYGYVIDRHCHHESARRGAKTGTQGLKGAVDRSTIPAKLCDEILDQVESHLFYRR